MRLLFVTPYYPPLSFGGIESQVETFARALARRDDGAHRAVVLAPGQKKGLERRVEDGVVVYRGAFLDPPARFSGAPGPSAMPGEDPRLLFERVLADEGIERVLAHNLHLWVPRALPEALLEAAAARGVPVDLRVHNFFERQEAMLFEPLAWRRLICVSQALARSVSELGVPENRLAVVPPPIDTELFRPRPAGLRRRLGLDEDALVVLQASRVVGGYDTPRQKGVGVLIEIFAALAEPAAHLVFCAAAPPPLHAEAFTAALADVERRAAGHGLAGRVHTLSVPYAEMPEIYNGADVFILLSRLETFGRVYAEAGACGRPVIGTPTGGVPEVIDDGVSGYLVRDPEETLERLRTLLADEELRVRMGTAGRERVVERFAVGPVSRRLFDLLMEPSP